MGSSGRAPLDEWPFGRTEELSGPESERRAQIALDANTTYLQYLVEGHHLCPFAKEARRRGETKRLVHFQSGSWLGKLLHLFVELANDESTVVVQVIFPDLRCSPEDWIWFCHELTRLGHIRRGGHEVMANAALHPHLPYKTINPFALIPLFRRSPDPTIQWIRLDQLERLYEGRAKGSTFVDPSEVLNVLEAPPSKSLYDRVAEANQATAQRIGVETLEAEFSELHARTRAKYEELRARG